MTDKTKPILSFVNFTKLNEEELLEVLEKRNLPKIRQCMKNSDVISKEDHLKFCSSLSSRKDVLYLKVSYKGEFIGVIDYQDIDYENHSYEPGSYFFNEENVELKYDVSVACSLICMDLNLYKPKIMVKKDNLKALIFNTMKLENYIVGEDDDFYYLTNNYLDPNFYDLTQAKKKLEFLNDKYDMVFEL